MRSGETDAPALSAGRRLSGEARRRLIVRQAALHFAESGFGATTRELAAALGVTQALLYRYFASKAEIVDAVFDAVFVADWVPTGTRCSPTARCPSPSV